MEKILLKLYLNTKCKIHLKQIVKICTRVEITE